MWWIMLVKLEPLELYTENATLQHFRSHFTNWSNRSFRHCVDEALSRNNTKNSALFVCVCVCVYIRWRQNDECWNLKYRWHYSFLQVGKKKKAWYHKIGLCKTSPSPKSGKSFLSTVRYLNILPIQQDVGPWLILSVAGWLSCLPGCEYFFT
jgi:hypothetical protein